MTLDYLIKSELYYYFETTSKILTHKRREDMFSEKAFYGRFYSMNLLKFDFSIGD